MKHLVIATITLLLMAGTCIAQDVISEPDIDSAAAAVQDDPAARQALEAECIALLSSDTPYPELYRAFRILAIIGSDQSVAPLAALLDDASTSHYARTALEGMVSEKAGQALRDALDNTTGAQRLGIISSLTFRRDAQAVDALIALLSDSDAETVASAANALGQIATPEAIAALQSLCSNKDMAIRLVGIQALLSAAGHIQGDAGVEIYKQLSADEMPEYVRIGAFNGMLEAQPKQALENVIAAIQQNDELLQLTAIAALSDLNDDAVAERLAELLPSLGGGLQALVISALAERSEPSVLPLLHSVIESDSAEARLAAMRAVAVHGNVSSVEPLCGVIEKTEDRQERMAAIETLRRLHGDDVDATLTKRMSAAPETIRGDLMDVLAQRNAVSAVDAIIEQIQYDALRPAAFRALTHIVPSEGLDNLLALLGGLKDDVGRSQAESAVVALCERIAHSDTVAENVEGGLPQDLVDTLAARLDNANTPEEKVSLLRVMSRLGGTNAYQLVLSHLNNSDPVIHDGAVRALANWPDVQAAPKLSELFAAASETAHRMVTLRGCVRLLRLGQLEQPATLALYESLVAAAQNADERKIILSGLADVNASEAIPLVMSLIEDESVQSEGTMALQRIGDATGMTETEMQAAKEAAASQEVSGADSDFTPIFDGTTLDGWAGEPALWRVEDGCIVGESTEENPVKVNTFLSWKDTVDNFELKFRYKVESEWANSGIQIRSDRFEGYRVRGYQADIASEDWIPGICYEEGGRGILARRGQKVELGLNDEKQVTQFADENELGALIKMDDWNEYLIVAQGNRFVSSINGTVMHEIIDNSDKVRMSGILAFQLHAGPPMKIKITDVMLKQLPEK